MAEQTQDILEEILQENEREQRLFGFDEATSAALRGVSETEEAALSEYATKNSEALFIIGYASSKYFLSPENK